VSSKRPVTLDKLFGYILVYKNNEKRSLMKKFREGTLTARILSKKKFLLFLIKLLRNPNISQKCKIGVIYLELGNLEDSAVYLKKCL
jgi:hypothetical protein